MVPTRAPRLTRYFCRLTVSERESRHHRRRPVTRAGGLDGRTEVEQRVDQRHLQSCLGRWTARDEQAHGRMPPAVHAGERVHGRACFEQGDGHRHRIGRGPLAVALHSVGRHVVKQRRPVHGRIEVCHAGRTRPHQLGHLAQQPSKGGDVAVDHSFHRRLEPRDGRPLVVDRLHVFSKPLPVLKIVAASHGELRVGQVEGLAPNLVGAKPSRQPGNCRVEKTGMLVPDHLDRRGIAGSPGVEQCSRLVAIVLERGPERQWAESPSRP